MSVVSYVPRVVTNIARNPAAVSALRLVASKMWEHRHLFGEGVLLAKSLFSSQPKNKQVRKRNGLRLALNTSSLPSSSTPVAMPLTNGYIRRDTNFLRMSASPDGQSCIVVGSQLIDTCIRVRGNAYTPNNLLFGGTQGSSTGSANVRRGFAKLLNPEYLALSGANDVDTSGGRLTGFVDLFSKFRFRHVHVKYVPRLNPTDSRHGTIQLAYASDPTLISNMTMSSIGIDNFNPILSSLSPFISGPSWAPFDFELNFPGDDWYVTNPEGANVGVTADDIAANFRQAFQGAIMGAWADIRNQYSDPGPPVIADDGIIGYFYADYGIEFAGPVWSAPDVTVSSLIHLPMSEKIALSNLLKTGWTPTEQTANDHTPSPTCCITAQSKARGPVPNRT